VIPTLIGQTFFRPQTTMVTTEQEVLEPALVREEEEVAGELE
jgi:hypothetical protein